MNHKSKQISEGAMMIAIIGVLLLINRQLANVLESSIYWILSFPMMIYAAKYGLKISIIPFISAMLLSLIIASPTTIFYLFSSLVVGITYGSGVKYQFSNRLNLTITIILELISMIITTFILANIFGYNIKSEVDEMVKIINQFDLEYMGDINQFIYMIVIISYVGTSIFQALVIHLLGHKLLERLNIETKPLKSIYEIKYPKWVGGCLLLVVIAYILCSYNVITTLYLNYFLTLYAICFIIGVSDGVLFLLCLLSKYNKRSIVFLILLGCFIPGLNNIIFGIGILDIIMDYRGKLRR